MEDYSQWRIAPWETPWESVRGLTLVSLVDDGELRIVVENVRDNGRPRWEIFCPAHTYPAYRNVLEDVRLRLWEALDKVGAPRTPAFEVLESPWLKSLRESEPLLDVTYTGARHWVITSEDDVVEVLASCEPQIRSIEPAAPESEIPGKSEVFYHPEDKERMREAFPHWDHLKEDA